MFLCSCNGELFTQAKIMNNVIAFQPTFFRYIHKIMVSLRTYESLILIIICGIFIYNNTSK
mgnify:CR=1 FL=1